MQEKRNSLAGVPEKVVIGLTVLSVLLWVVLAAIPFALYLLLFSVIPWLLLLQLVFNLWLAFQIFHEVKDHRHSSSLRRHVRILIIGLFPLLAGAYVFFHEAIPIMNHAFYI